MHFVNLANIYKGRLCVNRSSTLIDLGSKVKDVLESVYRNAFLTKHRTVVIQTEWGWN